MVASPWTTNTGGAIESTATGSTSITINDCVLTGNSTTGMGGGYGGAIFAQHSHLFITGSTLSGNSTAGTSSEGGAIYAVNGNVVVNTSTLSGNSTAGSGSEGGAIYARNGSISVLNSTLSGNSTAGTGSEGGAIASPNSGNVQIVNSTLSGNQVNGTGTYGGGAIYISNGDVTIVNSTITNNFANIGGGIGIIANSGGESLTIINSIIAGNTAATNPDFTAPGTPGTNLVVRNSLIGRNNDTSLTSTVGSTPDGNGNFVGGATPFSAITPLLGALAFNAGPTQTHALLAGSLALNSGDNTRATQTGLVGGTPLINDQRGILIARITGGTVDMGAFEVFTTGPLVVSTLVDELDGSVAVGDLSLREAIHLANGSAGSNVISFQAGLTGEIDLTLGDMAVTEDLMITGLGQANSRIDAQSDSRIFNVGGVNTDLTLDGLTLKNGRVAGKGGAILSTATGTTAINVLNSTLSGNSTIDTDHEGGAIFAQNSAVNIASSTVSGNSTAGSSSDGGAIFAVNGFVSVASSTLSGNSTAGSDSSGGAVYAIFGSVDLIRSTLSGNSTAGNNSGGGAIYAGLGSVTVRTSTLSGNTTAGPNSYGGAIASVVAGDILILNSTLSGNQVNGGGAYGGGAIYSDDGDITIVNSTITNNLANIGGGIGILANNSGESLTIVNSIIAGNSAATNPDFTAPGNPGTNLRVRNSLIGRSDGTSLTADATAGVSNTVQTASFIGGTTAGTAINPMLGSLAGNGGPTQTHAILVGSLALNSGDNTRATTNGLVGGTAITNDQRGNPFLRRAGGTVDMGAFESQALQSIVGNTASFVGTAGIDSFTYNIGTRVVRFGAQDIYVLPVNINFVTIDGLGARDLLSVLGTAGASTAEIGQGTLNYEHDAGHTGFDLTAVNLETILVNGQGGTDVVTFTGSTGNDKFFARPTSGFMLNSAFDLEAFNFEQMTGNLLTGSDLARFFDSTGNDTVTANPTTATIVDAGFTHTANGYDTLLAQSTAGGTDTVNLTGSTGDDTLTGGLGTATLGVAGGISLQNLSFEVVTANGVSGLDIARYTGSAGNDTFTAATTTSSMVGPGFSISATNFDRHFATGGGGAGDIADLTDFAGNDTFTGVGAMGTLSGTGFLQQFTSGFEIVRIRGINGGTNTRSITNPLGYTLQQFGTWV